MCFSLHRAQQARASRVFVHSSVRCILLHFTQAVNLLQCYVNLRNLYISLFFLDGSKSTKNKNRLPFGCCEIYPASIRFSLMYGVMVSIVGKLQ